MFTKNRRRTSLFSESSYRRRRSPIPQIPTPWLIAAIPAGLLLLELLLRLGVGLAGKSAELNRYMGEPIGLTDYRLKAHSSNQKPIEGIPNYGRLNAIADPLVGYRLQPKQSNAAVTISPSGFRHEAAVLPKNPKEVRILLIGGSTAFGSLASSNANTFAAQLEQRLNQQVQLQKSNPNQFRPEVLPYFADEVEKAMKLPAKIRDAEYRVVNAAVPGYISSNTVADYSSRLAQLKPDLVIVIDGYSDLLLSEQYNAATLPIDSLSSNTLGHLGGSLREMINGFFNHLYLTKTLRWGLKPQPPMAQVVDGLNPTSASLADRLPADPGAMKARVDRYQQNLQNLATLTNATKTPVMILLQPELSQRKSEKLTPAEHLFFKHSLGQPYGDRIKLGYQGLKQAIEAVKKNSNNVSSLALQPEFDKFNGTAFQDTIHLTDSAQKVVSDKLYDTIVPRFQATTKSFAEGGGR